MTQQNPTLSELSAFPPDSARYYVLMAVSALGLFLIVVLNPAAIKGQFNPLFDEGGFVDGFSPVGYLFCIVLVVAQGGFGFAVRRAWSLIVILAALTLRELDFQTRFTTMSVEKLKFFISGLVPLHQKVVALVVFALIAWAVVHLLARHGRTFLSGLKTFDPVSVATAISIALLFFSKAIDGLHNRLADIGYVIGPEAVLVQEKIEETAELGIPIFMIIAILAYFGSARNASGHLR